MVSTDSFRAMRFLGFFFFSSRRRHTRLQGDWSSDVCSSDLSPRLDPQRGRALGQPAKCSSLSGAKPTFAAYVKPSLCSDSVPHRLLPANGISLSCFQASFSWFWRIRSSASFLWLLGLAK